jgi:hypothetical protein
MKKWLVKIVFAGLLGFGLGCLSLIIQVVYQSVNQEVWEWIELGFPYRFYHFTPDFEFHGIMSPIGFIYDSLILFVFSFLIVHIRMKVRDKRSMFSENERIDESIRQNNR